MNSPHKKSRLPEIASGRTLPPSLVFFFGFALALALAFPFPAAALASPPPPSGWPVWQTPIAGPVACSNEVFAVAPDTRANSSAWNLRVAGQDFAWVNPPGAIVYQVQGRRRLTEIPAGRREIARHDIVNNSSWQDPDGATWELKSRYTLHRDSVEGEIVVTVDEDRDVLFLPLCMVFPGAGSFGSEKSHAVFSGLEYLDDEPSSSELDLHGPQSQRQIPPAHDITFPLMAIQANGRYLGLIWNDARRFAALFDSPDRIFGSGGHVMGLVWPACEEDGRDPAQLLPKASTHLKAHTPLRAHIWLVGGLGDSVVPAIQEYVRLRRLPPINKPANAAQAYSAAAEAGWLHSRIHVGDLYRHALAEGNFAPGPASDAAVFETWLAAHETNSTQRDALLDAAKKALAQVNRADYFHNAPGHIHTPAAALLFGHVPEAIQAARADAVSQLGRFDAEGRVIYHPNPGGLNFGQGHFAPDANGYTAATLINALESAAFCGDRPLIEQSVAMLRRQDHFRGSVPRGVQVWELGLHTPDIMAAAYLTRAYVDGFELTGDPHFLDEARHWAWSGVPFVYLRNPTGQPIGPYATIAVFGATHWQAPDWIGLPVQWCGLVYSDALYRLEAAAPGFPWLQIADGITWSGVQQTFPLDEPIHAGLLPDSFILRSQHRNPPDINPATLGASAIRLFTRNSIYDFRRLPQNGLLIHAPCVIRPERSEPRRARFHLDAWEQEPFYIVINGFPAKPRLRMGGHPVEIARPSSFDADHGQLILQLHGPSDIDLAF